MKEVREMEVTYKRLLKNMSAEQVEAEFNLLKKSIEDYGTNELRDLKVSIIERLFPRLLG